MRHVVLISLVSLLACGGDDKDLDTAAVTTTDTDTDTDADTDTDTTLPATGTNMLISEINQGVYPEYTYIELYNADVAPVSLDGWQLTRQNGGRAPLVLDLSGRVAPGATHLVGFRARDFESRYGFPPDATSNLSWDGDSVIELTDGIETVDIYGEPDVPEADTDWSLDYAVATRSSVVTTGSAVFDRAEWFRFFSDGSVSPGEHPADPVPPASADVRLQDIPVGTLPDGSLIRTTGVITGITRRSEEQGFFMQDPDGGEWSGIWVYNELGNFPDDHLEIGDLVSVAGPLGDRFEHDRQVELGTAEWPELEVIAKGAELPPVIVLEVADSLTDNVPWEGMRVRFEDVIAFTAADPGDGEWSVVDPELGDSPRVYVDARLHQYTGAVAEEASFTAIEGVMFADHMGFWPWTVCPTSDADVMVR